MDSAKLRSMVNKKADGDNNMSIQLYQMFFFEHILERLSKSSYKNNIILKGRLITSVYCWGRFKNNKRYGCKFKKYRSKKRQYVTNI